MLEDENEAIELCFALWPLLKRIPTKWETSAARKVSEEPIKILKSFLCYLLRRKAKYLSTQQNLNFQERYVEFLFWGTILDCNQIISKRPRKS